MPYSFHPGPRRATSVAKLPPSLLSDEKLNLKVFGQLIVAARALLDITRADLSTTTNIHHSNLAKMERGELSDSDRCAKVQRYFELAGIEFLAGTREIMLRFNPDIDKTGLAVTIDPTMPSGTRAMHPRALDLDDLLSLLESAGVQIEGAETLREVIEPGEDWCETLRDIATSGRYDEVRFTPPANRCPSERVMLEQLRAFPFANDSSRKLFVRKILSFQSVNL